MAQRDDDEDAGRKSRRRKPKKERPVRNLVFGLGVSRNVEPLRQAARAFVHLIAMVFSSGKLLDADDPLVTAPPHVPRSLIDVISKAHSRIEHTKEGLPQAALFYGVIAVIVGLPIALLLSILQVALTFGR